jgi:hypothetical protein
MEEVKQELTTQIESIFASLCTVITEISSAHGDKTSTSSNRNEVIHGIGLIS